MFGTGGAYTWVPLEQVQSITMNPPRAPRDVILRPANVVLADGVSGDVLIPGLYPDTHRHADDAVRLGRATEWLGTEGEVTRGAGCRLFVAGGAAVPLTDLTAITLETPGR